MLFGYPRSDIACPGCGFSPSVGMTWVCAPDGCGAAFDTFASQGQCPTCEARFAWTQCPRCNRMSPHRAWYKGSGLN